MIQRADYYVFIDFARERLDGTEICRGSLFTNQELAIAYFLKLEKVVFLQHEQVKLDGLLRYMGANAERFSDLEDVLPRLKGLIRKMGWKPSFSRHLLVEELRWSHDFLTYHEPTGEHRHEHVLYGDIRNNREDLAAYNLSLRLAYIQDSAGRRVPCFDRTCLKATGKQGYSHDVWPKSHEAFDLLAIEREQQANVYVHSALDLSPRRPIITQPGRYFLDYAALAQGFPTLRFRVDLDLTGVVNTTTAQIDRDGWRPD